MTFRSKILYYTNEYNGSHTLQKLPDTIIATITLKRNVIFFMDINAKLPVTINAKVPVTIQAKIPVIINAKVPVTIKLKDP